MAWVSSGTNSLTDKTEFVVYELGCEIVSERPMVYEGSSWNRGSIVHIKWRPFYEGGAVNDRIRITVGKSSIHTTLSHIPTIRTAIADMVDGEQQRACIALGEPWVRSRGETWHMQLVEGVPRLHRTEGAAKYKKSGKVDRFWIQGQRVEEYLMRKAGIEWGSDGKFLDAIHEMAFLQLVESSK